MEKTYPTSDLSFTAFLLANGVLFVEIIEERNSRLTFLLSNPSKCEELKTQYQNNASIPVQTFISKREMLISAVKERLSNKQL